MDIRKIIKDAMEKEDRTQGILAKRIGVDSSHLGRFFKNERGLSIEQLEQTFMFLGITIK